MERIGGNAKGAGKGRRIVLFAKSGTWWVQPFSNKPYTTIRPDSTWESQTHMGTEYAALLVESGYSPPKTTDTLPPTGNGVVAVAIAKGKPSSASPPPKPKIITFSGYDWEVLQIPTDSAGVTHSNAASNASVDSGGALHLRIARRAGEWTCAEIVLQRSLGYGTYSFKIRDATPFDAGTVLGMFTWDDLEAGQNHREVDVEISQWGDPGIKDAQYVIQPYYVAANVFRFDSPLPAVTHSFRWESGRVSFKSTPNHPSGRRNVVAEHEFTSGIPTPGGERVHINLYIYGKSRTPQARDVEVVIERFEFLP